MKLNEVFPSRFLKCEDLKGKELDLKIKAITHEELGQDPIPKTIASFTTIDKCLVVNKTNWLVIASLHGEDDDDWPGKTIRLYPTRVPFKGKLVDSIGIKQRIPTPPSGNDDIPF